jgi:hypothetical protein
MLRSYSRTPAANIYRIKVRKKNKNRSNKEVKEAGKNITLINMERKIIIYVHALLIEQTNYH